MTRRRPHLLVMRWAVLIARLQRPATYAIGGVAGFWFLERAGTVLPLFW